jgi:ligand-binding sensor domain-containing protein
VDGVDALVWSMAPSPGGGTFVATAAGLVHLNGHGRLEANAATTAARRLGDIRAVATDGDVVVVGSWGGGAHVWDGKAWKAIGPAGARVQAVAVGGDRIAIGTPDGGSLLGRARGTSARFASGGLLANDLSAVAPAPGGGAWIGTFDRGLQRVDAGGVVVGAWTERDGLLCDRTNALAAGTFDGAHGVFIATERGLAFGGDAGGLGAIPPFDHHLATVAVVGGQVFAGATDGLYVLRRDHLERVASFPLRRVTAIAATPAADGHPRFVGSAAGLVIHGDGGRDDIVDALSGLPEDWVTALAPDTDGVFVGTYRHGIVHVDGRGRATPVSASRWVSPGALVADGAAVLTGTLGEGLLIGPVVGDAGAWAPIAGLPDGQVTGLARTPGVLWIATRGGLARLALD